MKPEISDKEAIQFLRRIAVGRKEADIAPLNHIAHGEVAFATERGKYATLVSKRQNTFSKGAVLNPHGQVTFDEETWKDLVTHLSDGEGSNHIATVLVSVWQAVLSNAPIAQRQVELEHAMYLLVKAAHLTFPHVWQLIHGQMSTEAAAAKKDESAESQLRASAKPEPPTIQAQLPAPATPEPRP